MSSFGLELEICCWASPLELVPSFIEPTNQPEQVELLLSPETICPAGQPVALYNEVPEMSNFWHMDSQARDAPAPARGQPAPGINSLALQLQFPQPHITSSLPSILPSSAPVAQRPPEVTVIDPQQTSFDSSVILQHPSPESEVRQALQDTESAVKEMVEVEGSDTDYTDEVESQASADSQTSDRDVAMDDVGGVKLGTSKSPVIEAFVYCALKGWGVQIKSCTRNEVDFLVTDFDHYYNCSNRICSKQRPTEDISARIKGLKRWFPDFPARKAQISGTFSVSVGKGNNKIHKIRKIMNKNKELIGICKLRRSR